MSTVETAAPILQPGHRLANGKYEIGSILGEGAMGVVYRGRHLALERDVAIKVLHAGAVRQDAHATRFQREAQAASSLRHRNTVQILDFGHEEPNFFIVMEALDGRTLSEIVNEQGALSPARAVQIASQVCAGLAAAHDAHIVHRDVKPSNVMVVPTIDDDGRPFELVKVLDFGIAKLAAGVNDAERANAAGLTLEGTVCGTPEYMSPEQAQGFEVNPRADLYACGVLLYRMLTGRVPFMGETPMATMVKQVAATPTPPSKARPGVPEYFDDVLGRALAKDPNDRYEDAREMRRAMLALPCASAARDLASEPTLDPVPVGRAETTEPPEAAADPSRDAAALAAGRVEGDVPTRRRSTWRWAAALLLLLAAAGAAWALLDRPPAPEVAWREAGAIATPELDQDEPRALSRAASARIATSMAPPPMSLPRPDVLRSLAVVAGLDAGEETETAASTEDAAEAHQAGPEADAEDGGDGAAVAPAARPAQPTTPRDEARASPKRPVPRRAPQKPTPSPEAAAPSAQPQAPSDGEAEEATRPAADAPTRAATADRSDEREAETPEAAPAPATPEADAASRVAPTAPAPRPETPPEPELEPALDADISLTGFEVTGSLPGSVVERAVERHLGDLRGCYRAAAQRAGRDTGGAMIVRFQIDYDGRARGVTVGDFELAGVASCVRDTLGRVRSRDRPDTGTVEATFSMRFSPLDPR